MIQLFLLLFSRYKTKIKTSAAAAAAQIVRSCFQFDSIFVGQFLKNAVISRSDTCYHLTTTALTFEPPENSPIYSLRLTQIIKEWSEWQEKKIYFVFFKMRNRLARINKSRVRQLRRGRSRVASRTRQSETNGDDDDVLCLMALFFARTHTHKTLFTIITSLPWLCVCVCTRVQLRLSIIFKTRLGCNKKKKMHTHTTTTWFFSLSRCLFIFKLCALSQSCVILLQLTVSLGGGGGRGGRQGGRNWLA